MKNLLLSLALCLTAGLFAEPVRITGFEDNERQWKSANGKSGNALFTRISAGELPDGKHALEISFGGRKDIAPKMRHWGNVSFILPAKKIPAGAKVIRFWIKGKNTRGYGIIVRLGNYIHMGTQNEKKAWIDFADGEWFQYECALKDFVPANKNVKEKQLTSFKGINYLTLSAVGDWRVKAPNRQEQKFYVDLIEVE